MSQIPSSAIPPSSGPGVSSAEGSSLRSEQNATSRPANIPPQETVPATAPETGATDARMRAMRTAIQKSGGIFLLDQFCINPGMVGRSDASSKELRAQKKVLKQIEQVGKAFDKLDALGPEALKKVVLDKKTSRVVENTFKQLDTLDKLLADLEKIGGTSSGVRALRDASMARLCELSRFVGALQAEAMTEEERQKSGIHGFTPMQFATGVNTGSIRDMLAELAVTMHGNDPATRDVSAKAESLFNEVQAFKADIGNLDPQARVEAAVALRGRAVALALQVYYILAPPASGQSKSMPGEPALFRGIAEYARTAVADMDELIRHNPRSTISPLLYNAFPRVNPFFLEQCGGLPKFLQDGLEHLQENINTRHTTVTQQFWKRELTGEEVREASVAATKVMSGDEALLAKASLHIMKGILDGKYKSLRKVRDAFLKEIDPRNEKTKEEILALEKQAEELWGAFGPLRKASPEEKKPYRELYDPFMQESLLERTPASSRDAVELADAVERSRSPVPVERYLPLLFEQKAKLSTLVTAAMYDIAPEHLEVRPDSGTELGSKILGQGAVNTVRLCQYADDHGKTFNLVFKPESQARAGLEQLRIFSLGYTESIRTAKLNMASSTVADLLGAPQVLATSSLGFYNGTHGLFMSHAPGAAPTDLYMGEISRELRKNGKMDVMRGNLMRELCRLEWADLLAGQADRHGNNYLVDINPTDGSVTVTGIDNDGSFGDNMIGIITADLTHHRNQKKVEELIEKCAANENQKSPPYELKEKKLLVHLDQISSPEMYKEVRDLIGMNQMFLPNHIDKVTYDNLMALDVTRYRESLRPFLSQAALEAAVSRLESAKAHAQNLMQANRCLQDEEWRRPALLDEAYKSVDLLKHQDLGCIGLEFFARDFARHLTRKFLQ